MEIKKLVVVLNFATLVVSILAGIAIYDYKCFRCSESVGYFQFIDSNIFGLEIVIFVVIIAFLAKEEIPPKTQLMISFLSGIIYCFVMILMVMLYLKDYSTLRMILGVVATAALTALHLCVGIMLALQK